MNTYLFISFRCKKLYKIRDYTPDFPIKIWSVLTNFKDFMYMESYSEIG